MFYFFSILLNLIHCLPMQKHLLLYFHVMKGKSMKKKRNIFNSPSLMCRKLANIIITSNDNLIA